MPSSWVIIATIITLLLFVSAKVAGNGCEERFNPCIAIHPVRLTAMLTRRHCAYLDQLSSALLAPGTAFGKDNFFHGQE